MGKITFINIRGCDPEIYTYITPENLHHETVKTYITHTWLMFPPPYPRFIYVGLR
jgi:hypothetical protein